MVGTPHNTLDPKEQGKVGTNEEREKKEDKEPETNSKRPYEISDSKFFLVKNNFWFNMN